MIQKKYNEMFQMSLKYLTIKETLYNLTKEELKNLVNEIIINFPNQDLHLLEAKIKNIREQRKTHARRNFCEQVDELTKIPLEGRDWEIFISKRKEIFIDWPYIHKIEEKCYKYLMTITEEKMEIARKSLCTCFSPYYCTNNCDQSLLILGTAKLNKENGELLIEKNDKDEEILRLDKEWISKTLLLYSPLFINFRTIYSQYIKNKKGM